MSKLPYTARNDHMFKRIFGDSRDVSDLTAFLQATLDLPDEDYEEVTIVDPKLHPERPDDKWGVLDVLVRLRTGKMVDIEIQVCDRPDLRERAVFYLARMVSSQIGAGEDYDHIKRTISILITDFVLVTDSASYHNSYMLRDARTGSQFTDLLEIVTLELPKLPKNPDGSKMWPWLKFIDTDEREELLMLPEKNPQLKHAVGKLMELTADEREQMLAEAREKGRRDIAAMLKGARIEGREEGREEERKAFARKMLARGRPLEEIMEDTGLPLDEIRALMH